MAHAHCPSFMISEVIGGSFLNSRAFPRVTLRVERSRWVRLVQCFLRKDELSTRDNRRDVYLYLA